MNDYEKELKRLRDKIDKLDEKILESIGERTNIVFKIARHKSRNNEMIVDEDREKRIYDNVKKIANEHNLEEEFVTELYDKIIDYCRGIQRLRQ